MIYIEEKHIKSPADIAGLPVLMRNLLHRDFELGRVIIEVPKDIDDLDKKFKPKLHKLTYRIGFIYDCLGELYPAYGKERRHAIIQEFFNIDLSYRRFKDLHEFYDKNRDLYLKNRKFLPIHNA